MRGDSTFLYAVRTLAKSPGFTLAVLVSLALGIGANAAIFSVVNGLLFHPAGVSDPQTLVAPRVNYQKLGLDKIAMSAADFADVRDSRQIFSQSAMQDMAGFNYTGGDSPQRLNGALVTWQWFEVFRAKPLLGRGFHVEDDRPGANHVIVLSYGTWQKLFGGDRSILGRTVELNRAPYRVVGIMPAAYRWPANSDFWMPIGLPASEYGPESRFNENYFVIARLVPGVSIQRAAKFMQALSRRTLEQRPFARVSRWNMVVQPFTGYTSGNLRTPLFILFTAVGLVLLIACSNIAGLMLVRATARSRELAIRVALGATRTHLLSQVLSESVLLGVAGTGLGLLGAFGILNGLLFLARTRLLAEDVVRIDGHVLVFAACAGLVSALLFSLVPAWHISRASGTYEALKEGSRSETEGQQGQRVRSILVVAQIALASVLLIGSGLLLRTLAHLQEVDTGFPNRQSMTASVALPTSTYKDDERQVAFWHSTITNLSQTPGITGAAAASVVPFSGGDPTASFEVEARSVPPGDPGFHGSERYVSPDYFETLGISLLTGRSFNAGDRKGSQTVAIIDQDMARRYWPKQNPIGQRLRRNSGDSWATIIGVVRHVKQSSLAGDAHRGTYYFCLYQQASSEAFLVARGSGSGLQLIEAMRNAVRRTDPAQSVFDTKTLDQRIALALGPQQFTAEILIGFAGVALLLAATGLYGVISYHVACRTREIGIRTALGAERSRILRMVMSQTMRLVVAGLVLGTVAASFCASLAENQLFRVGSFDLPSLAIAGSILSIVAILATAAPAWRAVRIDPVSALRNE